ncbi:MAG: thioether cross-link-forming SCIFF peptide maturase [Defluviitaleaceae bacterium]|nr:thioether cross-link-forming SCIFF peptide maturase [Defluviitaleaceae bacterium]
MIHCFKIKTRNLVLDVESGALHQVDDAAMEILLQMQNACGDSSQALLRELQETSPRLYSEIRALMEAGQLFSRPLTSDVHQHMENRKPVVKALCLHMAHECNLRCAYCFAGEGNYSLTDRGLMPLEVGKRALDFLVKESGARRNLEVDFFGGEPMLNFDVVKELVAYGRSIEGPAGKKFRFTLTTNGALLTEDAVAYINQNMDNVVLSLDGRPSVNDRMRKNQNGSGSYAKIFPKIKGLADAREQKNYYVRGTFTRYNLDFAEDVLHLADAGFKNISVEPVVAPADADYALREEDLPVLFDEYEKLAEALLERERAGKGFLFFHFEMNLDGGPCIAKRVTGCGAGSEYLAVTPSGKLYPCHQFVGDERFQADDLGKGFSSNDIVREFEHCHVFAKPECAACWARYYCSGGCMATAFYANDSILKPDKISCELMRKRIECALYIFAERSERN